MAALLLSVKIEKNFELRNSLSMNVRVCECVTTVDGTRTYQNMFDCQKANCKYRATHVSTDGAQD